MPGYCDALAGEQEHHFRRLARAAPCRDAAPDAARRATSGRAAPRAAVGGVVGDHGQPLGEVRAADAGGVRRRRRSVQRRRRPSASATRCASAASASGVRADSGRQCSGAPGARWPALGARPAPPRRSTCALVPLNPNELTPARRGRAPRGQARPLRVDARPGSRPRRCAGSASWKCRCGGMRSCCSDSTTLISPATPAAASRWPMLVLTEPISSGVVAARPAPSAPASACTSIGSPSDVPVPCAST